MESIFPRYARTEIAQLVLCSAVDSQNARCDYISVAIASLPLNSFTNLWRRRSDHLQVASSPRGA